MKKLFLTIFKNKTHQGACKDGFQTRTFEEPDLSKIKNQQFDKSKAPHNDSILQISAILHNIANRH